MTFINGLFAWLVEQKILTSNPVPKYRSKKTGQGHEARDLFTSEELVAIFGPTFIKAVKDQAARYWIPLLLLHTGARPNEIAQLRTEDVFLDNDILCIRIHDEGEGQRLKTASSQRVVPVHPWLVRHGFQRYWEARTGQGHESLWDNLSASRNGPSAAVGKWFNKHLGTLGIKTPKKVFYSLRHTVATHLERAGVEDRRIRWVLGHSQEGQTFKRYSKPSSPSEMLDQAISKLHFESVWSCLDEVGLALKLR